MGKMSRQKGARAELEVARLLEEWWGQTEQGCRFKRTPLSGGWASPDVRGEFGVAGDLVTTARHFPFAVEVKHREGWSERNLFLGKKSPVLGWWGEAVDEAKEMGKHPLLFFKKNRLDWQVMVPLSFLASAYPSICTSAALRMRTNVWAWLSWDRLKALDPSAFATLATLSKVS
jgi:hypothetical protein